MCRVGPPGGGTGAGGDGLDALAFALRHEAERIERKRGTPLLVLQDVADARELLSQPLLPIEVQVHVQQRSQIGFDANPIFLENPQVIGMIQHSPSATSDAVVLARYA
jgi:hypothetical protein